MKSRTLLTPSFRHCLLIGLVSALCMFPAFIMQGSGLDMHSQSLLAKHFSMQLWQGELYPRWLQDMFMGDGSPVFFYYPPLSNYITACFAFLSRFDDFWAFYTPITASALLALLCSGITFYIWIKDMTASAAAALIGSLLYVTALNHIFYNFYVMLLFGTILAYVWVPLMMFFARGIARQYPYALAGFSVSLALLILTNLPMTLMMGPISVLYGMINCNRQGFPRQIASLGLAVLLGFGLSTFYLAPALIYIQSANISSIWITPLSGHNDDWDRMKELGFFFVTAADARYNLTVYYFWFSVLCFPFYYLKAGDGRQRMFFLAIAAGAVFLMLPPSAILWQSIDLLKILQFPNRLFAITTLSIAALAALCWPRLKWLSLTTLLLSIFLTVYLSWYTQVTPELYQKMYPDRYRSYQLEIDQYGTYLPSHNMFEQYVKTKLVDLMASHQFKLHLIEGDATTRVQEWKPRKIVFSYEAKEPSQVRVRQFDFPAWKAFKDGQPLDIIYDEPTGEMILSLPPGKGDVELILTKMLPERAGNAISMISAAILLLLVLLRLRGGKPSKVAV